jgi:BlaI family penicillinase repressor
MDLKQGDLENIILNALWDLEGDKKDKIFVGDVQDKIRSNNKAWAYTTVKTVLDRLVDKEIAIREKDGKKYLYRSVVKRDEAGILALQKVMRQYFKNDVNELSTCLQKIKSNPVGSLQDERLSALEQMDETRQTLLNKRSS